MVPMKSLRPVSLSAGCLGFVTGLMFALGCLLDLEGGPSSATAGPESGSECSQWEVRRDSTSSLYFDVYPGWEPYAANEGAVFSRRCLQ